jgi:hypothetical protein
MTLTKILDTVLPYTAEELRCGLMKQCKTAKRLQLTQLIQQWYEDKQQAISESLAKTTGGSGKQAQR